MNALTLGRVERLVSDIFQLPLAQVSPLSTPDTIETWDSLNHLNLVLALEEEFGVQFTPEEIEQLLSVELIAMLITEKLEGKGVGC